MNNVLELQNINKSFGSKKVIDDLSLALPTNKIISIIGKSGEGKTTLLKAITSLEKIDSGTIRIDGHELGKDKKQDKEIMKKVGLVFQDYNLFPHLTVLKNLTLSLTVAYKLDLKEAEEKAIKALEELEIIKLKDQYPASLSGGEKQRVAIARAKVLEPKILCFDEPTSALDPKTKGQVTKIIEDLKTDARLILIVTHDMNFAESVSDEIIFFSEGQVLARGTKDELSALNNSLINEFFLES